MTHRKKPESNLAAERWLNSLPQTSMDPREYLKYAFESGYQQGYDRGSEIESHQVPDYDEALDELQVADIPGLSHASIGFSVNENGNFVSDEAITLYVVDEWCEQSMEKARRICYSHGCECKVDGE